MDGWTDRQTYMYIIQTDRFNCVEANHIVNGMRLKGETTFSIQRLKNCNIIIIV